MAANGARRNLASKMDAEAARAAGEKGALTLEPAESAAPRQPNLGLARREIDLLKKELQGAPPPPPPPPRRFRPSPSGRRRLIDPGFWRRFSSTSADSPLKSGKVKQAEAALQERARQQQAIMDVAHQGEWASVKATSVSSSSADGDDGDDDEGGAGGGRRGRGGYCCAWRCCLRRYTPVEDPPAPPPGSVERVPV